MPPPALKKLAIAADCAAMLAMSAGVLSQPPQLVTEATAKALYLVGSNRLAVTLAGLFGLTLTKDMPSPVSAVVSSVPASNVSTGSDGFAESARTKAISAASA